MSKLVNPIIYTSDAATNQSNQNTAKAINDISKSSLNGIVLNSIVLSAGDNTIPHKLGHKLSGWHIVRTNAASSVYDTQNTGSQPEIFLYLNASATVTVDIYVF